MRFVAAARRVIGCVVVLSSMGWAMPAHAQLGAGSTWVRTDGKGKGITLTVEACCNGGLRLVWQITMGSQSTTMSVDSRLDGSESPALVAGKPSGETMAITRVDALHYTTVMKMKGGFFGTSSATISADGKSMTVESVMKGGGADSKVTETWIRK